MLLSDWALSGIDWIRGAGAIGATAFVVIYAAATVAFLPGSILTLAAGFVYGPLVGTAIVSPASVLGATGAFLLGRTLARDWISRRMAGSPKFKGLDQAIGREALKILVLIRLSPIFPFTLVNYAFGLTRISLPKYVLGSFIGMLPGTFLYVYLGSLVTEATQLIGGRAPEAGTAGKAFYWAGLLATIGVTLFVTRLARRSLRESLPTP